LRSSGNAVGRRLDFRTADRSNTDAGEVRGPMEEKRLGER
jgi:hypothetical protein